MPGEQRKRFQRELLEAALVRVVPAVRLKRAAEQQIQKVSGFFNRFIEIISIDDDRVFLRGHR